VDSLPESWQIATLDPTLIRMTSGFACSKSNLVPEGIAHLRPFNIGMSGEVDRSTIYFIPDDFIAHATDYHLETGDVLFNNTNSVKLVGKSAVVREPVQCAFSNHITRLRIVDKDRLDAHWLLLCLRNMWAEGYFAANCNRWIGQAGFNNGKLAEVIIPLPPLETQRRIVARLDALLAEVAEARRLHAEIVADTGRVMDAAVSQAFDDGIRSGWKWTTVGDLMVGKPQYGTSQKPNSDRRGVPVLRMGNIQDGELDFSHLKYVDLPLPEIEKYRLRRNDLVFNRTNSAELVGKTAVFELDGAAVYASYLIRFQVDLGLVAPRFVSFYVNSPSGRRYVEAQLVRAIGQVNVNAQKLGSMPIPIPSTLREQEDVVEHLGYVRAEMREMSNVQSENATALNDLEQVILSQASRGELNLPQRGGAT
jgi:type I restriction enzyme S subunit